MSDTTDQDDDALEEEVQDNGGQAPQQDAAAAKPKKKRPSAPKPPKPSMKDFEKKEYSLAEHATLGAKHMEHLYKVLFAQSDWTAAAQFEELGVALGKKYHDGQ
jgi:hypothetical protein